MTPVAGTESEKLPQTGGGLAIPLPTKAGRFTEVAPDTAGGATFSSTPAYLYDLGNIVVKSGGRNLASSRDDSTFIERVSGWVRYPREAISLLAPKRRYPIIIFQHGMGEFQSYKGYDYLAEELATHGYVVISVDGDYNNALGDPAGNSRGQLILGTLDLLRQIDKNGQIDANGRPGAFDLLQGKLDFTRIGIMGHSRGGQGISNAIKYNQTRAGSDQDDLKGALIKYSEILKGIAPDDLKYGMTEPISMYFGWHFDQDKPKIGALILKRNYPDLFDAVIPAVEFASAVKATLDPDVDLEKGTLGGISTEPVEVTPAVEPIPASIDDAKFDAAVAKYNLSYAAVRETELPYEFKGAFMLAPTDFSGNLGINNVPLVNLLPSCDGDMSNLQGAVAYDHNRFALKTDTAPRYQIFVKGANHDFYNRQWGDDGSGKYCDLTRKDSVRLSRPNQERNGLFIINSFMRYHVGEEQKFAAYWNGTAQLPEAACEEGNKTCDERTMLTVQKSDYRRKLIQRFAQVDSLKSNQLGGANAFSGFDADGLVRCDMSLGGGVTSVCSSTQLPEFRYAGSGGRGFLSVADHAELSWSKPDATITTDLSGISTKGMDSLTFRIAVVWPMGQEVKVTLTDSSGKTATVTASDYSDALYNTPALKAVSGPKKDDPSKDIPMTDRTDDALWAKSVPQLMNMVAIPLKAFEGVDTNNLKELKLVFPKESGKVAITDIELQNLGRDKPAQKLAKQ